LTCPKIVNVATIGTASIGYLSVEPPKDSLASYWSISGSNEADVLFSMDLPTNTIIDVDVTYQLLNGVADSPAAIPVSSTQTVVGGIIYQVALDGTSTNTLVPSAWNQF
jgi:hypothetical protein